MISVKKTIGGIMNIGKMFYRLIIAFSALLAIGSPASAATIKTFLLGGQSNMVGIGNIMDMPDALKAAQAHVIIYTAGTNSYGWTTLQPGVGASTGTFGPEVTFGRDMSQAFPSETIALIKVAWSGSSLAYDWRSPSAGGTPGPDYANFVSEVRKALASFPAGNTPEIRGMCWMQGESDACDIYPASEYESNLRYLIADLRAEFNVPQMPFVIAMIDRTPTWKEYAVVRQAEMNVANSVANVSGGATPTPASLGDVNIDGRIDIVDALLVAQYYVGLVPANFNPGNADVNKSGSIDIVDALRIARFYVGLITGF
jgi:hypothetical protein